MYGFHSLFCDYAQYSLEYKLRIASDIDTVGHSVFGRLMEANYSKQTQSC